MRPDGFHPQLVAFLQRLKRRRYVIGGLRTAFLSVASFLAVVLVAAAIDRVSIVDEEGRLALFFAVVAVPLLTALTTIAISLRRVSAQRFALLAQRVYRDPDEVVLSAVSLGSATSSVNTSSDSTEGEAGSPAFREALQERAAERARQMRVSRILPFRRLRPELVILSIVCASTAVAVFVPDFRYLHSAERILRPGADIGRLVSARVTLQPGDHTVPANTDVVFTAVVEGTSVAGAELHWTAESEDARFNKSAFSPASSERRGVLEMEPIAGRPGRFRVELFRVRGPLTVFGRAGDGESSPVRLDTAPRPDLVEVHKTYRLPEYLKQAPRTVVESHGELQALKGSRVDVRFVASERLRSAHLSVRFQDGSERSIDLDIDDRSARVDAFPLDLPGSYRVHFVGRDTGFESDLSPEYRFTFDLDAAPRIAVRSPAAPQRLAPDATLETILDVVDDHGLASVLETIFVNGERLSQRPLPLEGKKKQATIVARRDFGHIDVSPGDRVALHYQVEDIAGQTATAGPVELAIVAAGADRGDFDLLELCYGAIGELEQLSASAEGFADDATPEGERVSDDTLAAAEGWQEAAVEVGLRLERGLGSNIDPRASLDVLFVHGALSSIVSLRARPLLRAYASVDLNPDGGLRGSRHVPPASTWESGWKSIALSLRGLASASKLLLVELELDGILRRRLVIYGQRLRRLRRGGSKAVEGLAVARERRLIAADVRHLFEVLGETLDRFETPAASSTRRSVRTLLSPLRSKFIDIGGVYDERGWQEFQTAVARFLDDANDPLRQLRLKAGMSRTQVRRRAVRMSEAVETVAERAQQSGAIWEKAVESIRAAEELEKRPAAGAVGKLGHDLAALDSIDFDSDGAVRVDAAVDLLGAAFRVASIVENGRAAGDLELLRRVLEAVEDSRPRTARREWLGALRSGDDAALERATTVLSETPPQWVPETLARVGELFGILETAHELAPLVRIAGDLKRSDSERLSETLWGFEDVASRFRVLSRELARARGVAAGRQVVDLAREFDGLREGAGFRAVSSFVEDGFTKATAAGRIRIASEIERVVGRLASIYRRETDKIRNARESLRRMVPTISRRIQQALDLARQARDATSTLRDEDAEQRPDSTGRQDTQEGVSKDGADFEEAVDRELTAADKVNELRGALREEANAADMTTAAGQQEARLHDVAVQDLAPGSPRAGDLLLTLPALSGVGRKDRLDAIDKKQAHRVKALERLLAQSRAVEKQDLTTAANSSQEAEAELDIEAEMNQRYKPLAELAAMRRQQLELVGSSQQRGERQRFESGEPAADTPEAKEAASLRDEQAKLTERLRGFIANTGSGSRQLGDLLRRLFEQARLELRRESRLQKSVNKGFGQKFEPLAEREKKLEVSRSHVAEESRELVAELDAVVDRADGVSAATIAEIVASAAALRERLAKSRTPPTEAAAPQSYRDLATAVLAVRAAVDKARREAASLAGPTVSVVERDPEADLRELEAEAVETVEAILWRGRRLTSPTDGDQRSRWQALSDRASAASARLRDATDRVRSALRKTPPAGGDAEKRLRAIDDSAFELGWAAEGFQRRPTDGLNRLAPLPERLGAHDGAGARGRSHRELGVARLESTTLAERLRTLATDAGATARDRRSRADSVRLKEQRLRDDVAATTELLDRAGEHARRVESQRAVAAEFSLEQLAGTARPAIEEMIAALHRARSGVEAAASAESAGYLGLRAEEGIDAAYNALHVALHGGGAVEAALPPQVDDGEPGVPDVSAEAGGALVRAMDAMVESAVTLRKSDFLQAARSQRNAADELARAMAAIGAQLAESRKADERGGGQGMQLDVTSESETERPGDPDKLPGDGGGIGDGASDPEDIEFTLQGNEPWIAGLPSKLKREILQARRERIPARFRPRVEAYFRALSEAAAGNSPPRTPRGSLDRERGGTQRTDG